MPEFSNNDEVIIFASGVSNSKETRQEAFDRESNLLEAALASGKPLVYFSTCSVHDVEMQSTKYVLHKHATEAKLAASPQPSAVFRLPQVVGKTSNPYTLTNYLHAQIQAGLPFQVWQKARRNLIDVSDVARIATHLLPRALDERMTTNIACPFSVPIQELVATFENVLGKKANTTSVDAGASYGIDVSIAAAAALEAGVRFDTQYIDQLIRKYYAP